MLDDDLFCAECGTPMDDTLTPRHPHSRWCSRPAERGFRKRRDATWDEAVRQRDAAESKD